MKTIKSFIYLDEDKMYSLSSQLFKGLTEYITREESKSLIDGDSQKGEINSGLLMANIINQQKKNTEKKFLHDYAYTLFEEELINARKVLSLNKDNFLAKVDNIKDYSFVLVKGVAAINDTKKLADTINNFNDFGEALAYLQLMNQKDSLDQKVLQGMRNAKTREQRAQVKHQKKIADGEYRKIVKEMGLNLEESFMQRLEYIIKYGYGDMLELQLPLIDDHDPVLFSTVLKRDLLKVEIDRLTKLYSRHTDKPITIFGIITQFGNLKEDITELESFKNIMDIKADNGEYEKGMKEAIMNLVTHLQKVDNTFTGRLENEFVLYPIAVYQEL